MPSKRSRRHASHLELRDDWLWIPFSLVLWGNAYLKGRHKTPIVRGLAGECAPRFEAMPKKLGEIPPTVIANDYPTWLRHMRSEGIRTLRVHTMATTRAPGISKLPEPQYVYVGNKLVGEFGGVSIEAAGKHGSDYWLLGDSEYGTLGLRHKPRVVFGRFLTQQRRPSIRKANFNRLLRPLPGLLREAVRFCEETDPPWSLNAYPLALKVALSNDPLRASIRADIAPRGALSPAAERLLAISQILEHCFELEPDDMRGPVLDARQFREARRMDRALAPYRSTYLEAVVNNGFIR